MITDNYDVSGFRRKCQSAMSWAEFNIIVDELQQAWYHGYIDDDTHDQLCGILELYLINFSKWF